MRDRGGRELAAVSARFHIEALTLVRRTPDGRLLRTRWPAGDETPITGPGTGIFAVNATGALAYVRPAEGVLVVETAEPGGRHGWPRRLTLPPGLAVRDLEWPAG